MKTLSKFIRAQEKWRVLTLLYFGALFIPVLMACNRYGYGLWGDDVPTWVRQALAVGWVGVLVPISFWYAQRRRIRSDREDLRFYLVMVLAVIVSAILIPVL